MAAGERECPPCRGTGRIVSTQDGEPKPVTCPWCGGSGVVAPLTPPAE